MRKSFLVMGILWLSPLALVNTGKAWAGARHCAPQSYKPEFCVSSETHKLSESTWHKLATHFYRNRYRVRFRPNNHFLRHQDVVEILGFTGVRTRISKHNSHQYWYWQDSHEPQKKIEAVFVYDQLASLRSRGFDPQALQVLRVRISSQINQERFTEHRIFP